MKEIEQISSMMKEQSQKEHEYISRIDVLSR